MSLAGNRPAISAFSLAHLAVITLQEGDEEGAFDQAQRARAFAERSGIRTYIPSLMVHAVLAHVLSRRGDVEEARRAVGQASELLPRASEAYWWLMIEVVPIAPAT